MGLVTLSKGQDDAVLIYLGNTMQQGGTGLYFFSVKASLRPRILPG